MFPGRIISERLDCVSAETQHRPLLVEGCHCFLSPSMLSAQLRRGLPSSRSAVGFRVPFSRVQPSSPALVHHRKICRPTAQAKDTISPSDNFIPQATSFPTPYLQNWACLPTAAFLACKLGLNLQWCHRHSCLEPSPLPRLAWHIALEASATPSSIPTLRVGLLVLYVAIGSGTG